MLCVDDVWWWWPSFSLDRALSPQVGWVWAIYWGFKAYGPLGEGGEL